MYPGEGYAGYDVHLHDSRKVVDGAVIAALAACLGARFRGTSFAVTVVRYRGGPPWINACWAGGPSWHAVARFVESLETEAKKVAGTRKTLLFAGAEKPGFQVVVPAGRDGVVLAGTAKSPVPVSNVCFAYEYFGLLRIRKCARAN